MTSPIVTIAKLGFPWATLDPFLFCVHHNDAYPAGNEQLGIDRGDLVGRHIGQDFSARDGYSMYHGDIVPGFPQHPHRGFETVTLARRGYIDHSDSLGATARFGSGDVQWMTAGEGIVHSEMFPLVHRDAPNPTELFQIWLNLPAVDKTVEPYFTMLWGKTIPKHTAVDNAGKTTEITLIAGATPTAPQPPAPPPNSWASRADAAVAIWAIKMEAGATWTLPATVADANRVLYFFSGPAVSVGGTRVDEHAGIQLRPDAEVTITADAADSAVELLLLSGRPIGEPVEQYGPFVMNNRKEIEQAFVDFRRTGFGGWPWPSAGPVHAPDEGRFAVHADGREERPDS